MLSRELVTWQQVINICGKFITPIYIWGWTLASDVDLLRCFLFRPIEMLSRGWTPMAYPLTMCTLVQRMRMHQTQPKHQAKITDDGNVYYRTENLQSGTKYYHRFPIVSTGARDCLPPRVWVIWASGRVAICKRQRGVQAEPQSMASDRKGCRDLRPLIRSRCKGVLKQDNEWKEELSCVT